jgi:hypothetical protein
VTPNSVKTLIRSVLIVLLTIATWELRTAPLPTKLQGALMLACAVLIGDLGMKVARRLIPFGVLKRHSAAQLAIFAVVGTVYGMIAAFVIVVVWENYSTADTTVSREANALGDLEGMSRGFDVQFRRQVQEAAHTYAYQVIHEEWPAMRTGGSSDRAHAALTELWSLYTEVGKAKRGDPLYDHSIDRLGEVDDQRRIRLAQSKQGLPALMWLMLYAGAFAAVALAYFFESPTDWFHRLVIAMLSGTLMFSIFLVVALEAPFGGGDIHVNPDAFQFVMDHMQNLEK